MKLSLKWIGSLIVAGILSAPLAAQETKPAPSPASAQAPAQAPAATPDQTPAPPPPANPADVASPDAIIAAAYDVISGPAGHPRDWKRFRSLFIEGGRLIATGQDKDGNFHTRVVSPDGYVAMASAYFDKSGFYERESAHTTESWANIQQVFSTYESRHDSADPTPFERGINSFQLLSDGKRWYIVTIFWQEESAANPIPPKYLPAKK